MNKPYLRRNLIKTRNQGRKGQPRKTLKILDWVGKLKPDFMSLMFVGAFGEFTAQDEVEVKLELCKMGHSKRKHNSTTVEEMCGSAIVPINPKNSAAIGQIPALSIPIDNTTRLNESVNLRLVVKELNYSLGRLRYKRYKLCGNTYESHNIIVVDELQRRVLLNGEYEILLQPVKSLLGSPLIPDTNLLKEDINLCGIQQLPKLKYFLKWSKVKLEGMVDHPAAICLEEVNPSGSGSTSYLKPVRKTIFTEVIFYRPKRLLSQRRRNQEPLIAGDDRFDDQHDSNVLDVEPEYENIPAWLQVKTKKGIDQLVGVNEHEKAIMIMWNIHIMSCRNFDRHMEMNLESFILKNGLKILQMKLYNYCILHMVNLVNLNQYGTISVQCFNKCVKHLHELARDNNIELKNIV